MEETIHFELDHDTIDNLHTYATLLNKDINMMMREALENYFEQAQKKLVEKSIEDENALTNLDYDEFWDGVDLE